MEAGLGVLLGEVAVFVGVGFAALVIFQTNFFPLLTHFRESEPDFALVPTLAHGLPGDLAAAFVEAIAKGAARTARANNAAVITRDDFLREAFMEKRYPQMSVSTSKG